MLSRVVIMEEATIKRMANTSLSHSYVVYRLVNSIKTDNSRICVSTPRHNNKRAFGAPNSPTVIKLIITR